MTRLAQDAVKSDHSWSDQVTVTDTPTLLFPANHKRIVARAFVAGGSIEVGFDNTLAWGQGTPIGVGEQGEEPIHIGTIYAICAAGQTADVRIHEVA